MIVTPIKIDVLHPPQDDLLEKIRNSSLKLKEGDVIAITSKVVSIWQGRCVEQGKIEKDVLIHREAEYYLDRDCVPGKYVIHTIKEGMLIASAGIDTSNGKGYYVLWPQHPQRTAKKLLSWLKKAYGVKKLSLIITDSHCVPMRRGVLGVALAWAGINPLYDNRGKKDLFGEELCMSQTNVVDALAVASVFVMGEASEGTPLALIRGAPFVERTIKKTKHPHSSFHISLKSDLFAPMLSAPKWKKGGAR